jgi:DNA-binding MarR family transcriptional regulator
VDLDKLIHAPARLAIMTQLMVIDEADATWLQGQTGLSWGNLASHVRKLEAADYLVVSKEFAERKPRTVFRLTEKGRSAYQEYRRTLLDLLE